MMVTEVAFLEIDPENAAAFEAAVASCKPCFEAAGGCRSMALARVSENAGLYRLLVDWETIEDHMVGFRNSADFQRWRAITGPFFVKPPRVEHLEVVARYFDNVHDEGRTA